MNTPTPTIGAAPRPAFINGIGKVSLLHTAQLTYLTFRALSRYKKAAAGAVMLVLIPLLFAAVTYPAWSLWAALVGVWLVLAAAAPVVGVWVNTHPPHRWVVGMFSDTGTQLVRQDQVGLACQLGERVAAERASGAVAAHPGEVVGEVPLGVARRDHHHADHGGQVEGHLPAGHARPGR